MSAVVVTLDVLFALVLWFGFVGLSGWAEAYSTEGQPDLSDEYTVATCVCGVLTVGTTWYLHALGFRKATVVQAFALGAISLAFATGIG
ncbi:MULTISPECIES: hypothetical protein [unclassified Streptomyces]|uniref:hypothetical protein n=1 Tax=unclassified Streptomyces TaxID=2593676 RepID=UPI0019050C03|nr:hypothetical protein [Streptomyces sp. HSG2]